MEMHAPYDTDLAFCDGLFDLLDLDLAEALDLEERLACGSVDGLHTLV